MVGWLEELRHRHWPGVLALVVAFALFISEPTIVDFFRGGHYNWVSLHSLAIVKHSRLAFGGVGFSCLELQSQGRLWHEYFNRYPLPFAVLSRWVLEPWSGDAVSWLYAARQWMNLIFIATAVALWSWLRAMRFSRPVAMAALLLTGAAPVVQEYRSMFHVDQPALLAYALLLVVVMRKLLIPQPEPSWYLGMLLVAALSGRSAVMLIFSLVLPLLLSIVRSPSSSRSVWWGVPIAFGSVLVATTYNIVWEMRLNTLGWSQTSVVQSALRRLNLSDEGFSPAAVVRTRWLGGALFKMADYLSQYLLPLLTLLGLLLLFWCLALFTTQARPKAGAIGVRLSAGDSPRRFMLWSTGLTSLLWLVVMKNLFVFHVYAGMVIVPFLLLGMAVVLDQMVVLVSGWAAISDRLPNQALVCASVSVFLLVLLLGPSAEQRPDQQRRLVMEGFFKELAAYQALSPSPPLVVKNDDWFPRSPYAQCALLDGPFLLEPPKQGGQAPQPPSFPSKP